MIGKKKILVAGDVNGNFTPILKRLSKFDFCICVGRTCSLNSQLSDILNGKVEFPKPVYFIDNGPLKDILSVKYQNGGSLTNNFHYLGNFGVKKIEGFKVGFLSGSENLRKLESRSQAKNLLLDECNVYVEGDYINLVSQITEDPSFKGLDFLLTCEWPADIESMQNNDAMEAFRKDSSFIAKLAFQTMPRYHFSANNDCFVKR